MSRLAGAAFAVLVLATFGAFFVAQRVKNEPPVVQRVQRAPLFSPNGDGRLDRARFSFVISTSDRIAVEMLDAAGDPVRRLVEGRPLRAYRRARFAWDGRDDAGALVPDGRYRFRVTLEGEGRSYIVPRVLVKDTVAPTPEVLSVGPQTQLGPELLPEAQGRPVRVRFASSGVRNRVRVVRTSPGPERDVVGLVRLPRGATTWTWDGRGASRPGTYVVVVEAQDRAGNIGGSVPLARGTRLPVLEYGRRWPGRGGVTVRRLAVQPPSSPVAAGERTQVRIDARGEPWTAQLRRVGSDRIRARYSGTRAQLSFVAPEGATGLYELTVRTGTTRRVVPIAVQGRPVSGSGRVLVVLPWLTWQARNPVDDDGDGRPNLLDQGLSARTGRPFAAGVPGSYAQTERPELARLSRRRFDLTTDLSLVRSGTARLGDYDGVLLAGDVRWLPSGLATALRRYVAGGGALASLGTGSLRRLVTLTPKGTLTDPTSAADADAFGSELGSLERRPTTLTATQDDLDLFAGTDGLFRRLAPLEPTTGLAGGVRQVAAASTPGGRPVVVATRVGQGVVIRTGVAGLPGLAAERGGASAALLERTFALLRAGGRR